MGTVMLRRIEWLKDAGLWDGYRWDTSLPDLARLNLVYGPNGSGKTSLSQALAAACESEEGARCISVRVEDHGEQHSTNGQDDQVFERIHIFNEDYVARSHRFHEPAPTIDAVLTLGERTVEAQERLASLREQLSSRTEELQRSMAKGEAADRALTAARERVSVAVVEDLSHIEGYRSRSSYNVGKVGRKYDGDRTSWVTLTDDDLAVKKRIVASSNRDALDDAPFSVLPDTGIPARAQALLAATPVTVVLDTLRTHPDASSWVQSGLPLHEHSENCLFCGQQLPAGRLREIEGHFSDAVARIQRELDDLDDALESLGDKADAAVARIPAAGLLFEDLRSDLDAAAEAFRTQAAVLREWISNLRERARTKRANVLESVASAVTDIPAIDGGALESLLSVHNTRVADHKMLVAAAAEAIEGHHLKAAEADIDRQTAASAAAQDAQASAQRAIDEIDRQIAELEITEGDPTPTAGVLTREVARLLGHSELVFQARASNYVVTRDGQPAAGLSTGERTVIALIHFLESVARHDASKGKPIVVIDDPVSSLDSNAFMGISTYIWTAAVSDHVAQLVLLTHNFDLFKQWDIQIEGLPGHKSKNPEFPSRVYELRTRHIAAGTPRPRRRTAIVEWPETPALRKKVRSGYHHAFMTVARARIQLAADDSLEARLDAQLLFPNVIRRMLESFLAFKRPDWVGDLAQSMSKAGELLRASGYAGDADALRLRLTRYAHAYSHSQTPETAESVSPGEVAAAMSSVFAFMHQLDRAHFEGLCAVAGFDPASLLPAPILTE